MSSVFENIKSARKKIKEGATRTFANWLCYYNNLDVAPGLEVLGKMRALYTQ